MARASSPPDAARASGCTGSPTLAPSASSTGSPVPSGATRTSIRAPAMARATRRSPTRSPNAPAAWARVARTASSASASSRRRRSCSRLQTGRLALGILERGQPGRAFAAVGHHRAQVLAVLAPQLAEQPAALLDLGEALRIVLPSLDLVTQRARHVGQLDRGRGQRSR